jgi:hypothetical protein
MGVIMPVDAASRRMAIVEEHVRCENAHHLGGVIRTFGETAPRQLGVFREPQTALGGIDILLSHPLTILKALTRSFVELSNESVPTLSPTAGDKGGAPSTQSVNSYNKFNSQLMGITMFVTPANRCTRSIANGPCGLTLASNSA